MRKNTFSPRILGSLLFTGAAATAIALAPQSVANPPPPPPPCFNPDGGPCGVEAAVPGAAGVAGPQGVAGAVPGGIYGTAGPDGAAGCVPGVGCTSIPAP